MWIPKELDFFSCLLDLPLVSLELEAMLICEQETDPLLGLSSFHRDFQATQTKRMDLW
jgi:hypothetical protein